MSLVFCVALLSGCGSGGEYVECPDRNKKGELDGKAFVNDDGINRNACKDLGTTSEDDLADHKDTAIGNKRLCQWSGHKDKDWLCVYTPAE